MMNPMLIPVIVLGLIVIWFILSSLFRFIGKIASGIFKHTAESLDLIDDDEEEE